MKSEKLGPDRLTASSAVGSVWWYFLIRGLLILGAGIFVLLNPGQTAVFFAQLVGLLILIDGGLAIVAAVMGRAESRLWSLTRGAIMVSLGLFFVLKPDLVASLAMKTVFFVVGPIVILSGIFEIVRNVRARRESREGTGSLLTGILAVVFGILLIVAPIFYGLFVIRLLAIGAILFSLILLFLSLRFRKLSKKLKEPSGVIDV
ncbi:HdeD family acid-resistance protein [Haloferula sp. A504]|uniref:HdeD family acid-resistance protein n=1 Tax=Haloferula sp. A504 TaxID=3373601 RepID=UPI0031C20A41|nr:DUF308 domain-containing protein [Verrucomicrobiaceae bacterium E54]